MTPGPMPGTRPHDEKPFADKAREAWGGSAPDWILELAALADQLGTAKAGKQLGYSAPVISEVIRNRYKGDVGRVEEKVRGVLMGLTVMCPVLDEISRNVCLDWQKKPRAQTSSLRARMWRACAACPNFRAHAERAQEVPDD